MAKILLIDDSDLILNVVTHTLGAHGDYKVDTARDFKVGVHHLRRSTYDIILMDLNMPQIRGEAGVKLLRQRLKLETPIIVLSGEITIDTIAMLKPLGVKGFVAKGKDFESRLMQEIEAVLGRQPQ